MANTPYVAVKKWIALGEGLDFTMKIATSQTPRFVS